MTKEDSIRKEEMAFVVRHIESVRKAGWGVVSFKIQNGRVVYAHENIGEQLKMDIDGKD